MASLGPGFVLGLEGRLDFGHTNTTLQILPKSSKKKELAALPRNRCTAGALRTGSKTKGEKEKEKVKKLQNKHNTEKNKLNEASTIDIRKMMSI